MTDLDNLLSAIMSILSMKTKEQVQAEEYGHVFTLDEFFDKIESGCISPYDGYGYFHDGQNETNICVWDDSISLDDIEDMPYVIWYNK